MEDLKRKIERLELQVVHLSRAVKYQHDMIMELMKHTNYKYKKED